MGVVCDLEVDVNGEHSFFVDKRLLSSYSGKLCQLFEKSPVSVTNPFIRPLKVILHDLPGGSQAFELLTMFCYSKEILSITPSDVCPLHCAAIFMEMKEEVSSNNLISRTEKYLEEMGYWTWSENLVALKQCQEFIVAASSSGVLQKIVDSMLPKITSNCDSSPSNSSPESPSIRFSCNTKSNGLSKNGQCWWFDDLSALNPQVIEKLIMAMLSCKFNNLIISRFLYYYFKSCFASSTPMVKLEVAETVVNLLNLCDKSSVSCKGLFGILRMISGLAMSKSCRDKLETMIGKHLDQVTFDNLIFPAPNRTGYRYDVNLVLRFLKYFVGGDKICDTALKRVGTLMDKYIAEVAPDSGLKPSKFIQLLKALPDSARESYDEIYRALDVYLAVHKGLSEEEKIKICGILNHEKLSLEACKHIAQNSKIPSRTALLAVVFHQSKLKMLLDKYDVAMKSPISCKSKASRDNKEEGRNQIVLFTKRLDLSMENEKLRAHLRGMQWKVMELETLCQKLQTQMSKIMKKKAGSHGNAGLPRFCS